MSQLQGTRGLLEEVLEGDVVGQCAVIILNWHAYEATQACAEMVQGWKDRRFQVVVVDNGSGQMEQAQLSALESDGLAVIYNQDNVGYAGGVNTGICYALDHEIEYVLLLNNDAFIDQPCVDILLSTLQHNQEIDVVGPVIYDLDYSNVLNAGGLDIATHDVTHRKIPKNDSAFYAVDYVSGTVFLARTALFREHGLLDEDYFFSGEIADFCRRSGALCAIAPGAKAKHDTLRSDAIRANLYTYYTVRNRYLYIHKRVSTGRWRYYPRWWRIHARHAARAFRASRKREAAMVLRGMVDGMRGRTGPIAA